MRRRRHMKKLAAVQRWTPTISEVDPPGTPTPNILGRSIWSDWPEHRVTDVCRIRRNQGNPEPGPFIPLPEEAISATPLAAFTVAGGQGSHLGYDGRGGSLKALIVSGSVGLMKNEDIDTVSYFRVDNSLIRCLGPTFLGYHIPGESQMSSKTIPIHAIACALWLQAHLS